jgi:hypothetical protein
VSSYNPYAAPAAETSGGGANFVRGEPQPWEVGEAIKSGWEIYRTHWAPLTFGYFIVASISTVPQQVAPVLAQVGVLEESSRSYYAVYVPLAIVGWLAGEFLTAGFIRAALNAVRTNNPSFGDFFAAGGRFIPFVLMSLLRTTATFVGLLFLIVPGVIVSLGFANAPFFVMDQGLGPVAALKASWDSTEGQKGHLLLLSLAELGLMLLGLAACCLGLFVAVPVALVARVIVYTKMSGTAPPPAAPPGGYGPPGTYGGYGPPGTYGGYGPPGTYGGYGPIKPPGGFGPPGSSG